jgi:hypothetical protein
MNKEKIELIPGKYYHVDYGSGHENNYTIAQFRKEDATHFYWENARLKKWKDFPEKLDNGGYTVKTCRNIRLATEDEIERLQLLQKQ